MKTNVATTSSSHYHKAIKGEHEEAQDSEILEVIKELNVCSYRMIWNKLNHKIEPSSIARSLNNLKKKQVITSPYSEKCPVTNVRVQWYTVVVHGQIIAF